MTTETTIRVVVDVEGDDPEALGTYLGTDDDRVNYRDADGAIRIAPEDCVVVLPLVVTLP